MRYRSYEKLDIAESRLLPPPPIPTTTYPHPVPLPLTRSLSFAHARQIALDRAGHSPALANGASVRTLDLEEWSLLHASNPTPTPTLLPFVSWLPKQAAPSLRALLAPQALPPPLPPPQALPPPLPPPPRELAAQAGTVLTPDP